MSCVELVCVSQLRPKVFQLLTYLIMHWDRVVLKDELVQSLWPDQCIGDAALKACLMVVRKAVGHGTKPTAHSDAPRPWLSLCRPSQHRRLAAYLYSPGLRRCAGPRLPPQSVWGRPTLWWCMASASPIAPKRELKQVSVLCCSLVDASILAIHLDPEAMHALMHEVLGLAQGTMQRYEGTMTQYTEVGFMALFGAPVAHEDHARRAVLAALEFQQQLGAHRPTMTLPQEYEAPGVPGSPHGTRRCWPSRRS